jgi:hypothetical protein
VILAVILAAVLLARRRRQRKHNLATANPNNADLPGYDVATESYEPKLPTSPELPGTGSYLEYHVRNSVPSTTAHVHEMDNKDTAIPGYRYTDGSPITPEGDSRNIVFGARPGTHEMDGSNPSDLDRKQPYPNIPSVSVTSPTSATSPHSNETATELSTVPATPLEQQSIPSIPSILPPIQTFSPSGPVPTRLDEDDDLAGATLSGPPDPSSSSPTTSLPGSPRPGSPESIHDEVARIQQRRARVEELMRLEEAEERLMQRIQADEGHIVEGAAADKTELDPDSKKWD